MSVYTKFLQEAQPYHAKHISLTGGGEPTLHRDFEAILAATAAYRYTFTLVTNGSTFQDIFPLLKQHRPYLRAVVFSLDGATAATHDRIRGVPGSYERVLEACLICHRQKIPFHLSYTVHRGNLSEIEAFVELAEKLGAAEVNIGCAQLTRKLVANHLALSPLERKELWELLERFADQSSVSVNPSFDLYLENPCVPCLSLRMSSLMLDYAGHIRFCCQLSGYDSAPEHEHLDIIGDLRECSLWECHRRLVQRIAEFQQAKITRVAERTLTMPEYFPCYYCGRYFHKFDWLTEFPDSEWMPSHE